MGFIVAQAIRLVTLPPEGIREGLMRRYGDVRAGRQTGWGSKAMGRRRIEMFQYRQALVRLRQGDSERVIARSRLMGRPKAAFRTSGSARSHSSTR
jgi:hypothetical protein